MVYDHDKEELVNDLIAERDAALAANSAIHARMVDSQKLCELLAGEKAAESRKALDAVAKVARLELEIKHLRQRLADALRVLASIGDQIRCDSPIQSQHCDECAEQLSDADLLSESIRCEDCEATRRIEIAADEAEGRKVDAAVERDQARRHGEVIE